MRLSQLFTKTSKNAPRDIESLNAQLLIRAGFVDQLMAGVYSYLPLGLRVLKKIEQIVREELDSIGSQEVLMPSLHPKSIWKQTGAWDSVDVLFKIKSRTGNDYALGQSEEEVVTPLVLNFAKSHKNLPVSVYQINWKYRDELRAKSGILRGREFYMKDMYSFHKDQADFLKYYELVKDTYLNIFSRLGLEAKVTEASGGSFSEKISYEFMVITDAGEDDILYSEKSNYCVNTEITKLREGDVSPDGSKLKKTRASEVGNVFDLGQKYPKDFDLSFTDESGKNHFPVMGCYGIGISRVMGVIAETHNDERGLIWPKNVAPAQLHLISVSSDKAVVDTCEKLYKELSGRFEVIYDDRDVSAGQKFAEADLIGVPIRLTVSANTLQTNAVEVKPRNQAEIDIIPIAELDSHLSKII